MLSSRECIERPTGRRWGAYILLERVDLFLEVARVARERLFVLRAEGVESLGPRAPLGLEVALAVDAQHPELAARLLELRLASLRLRRVLARLTLELHRELLPLQVRRLLRLVQVVLQKHLHATPSKPSQYIHVNNKNKYCIATSYRSECVVFCSGTEKQHQVQTLSFFDVSVDFSMSFDNWSNLDFRSTISFLATSSWPFVVWSSFDRSFRDASS